MSASQYQGQLERKRKQRLDADKRAGEFRAKESSKRADASKARLAASRASSSSTRSSKLREAERREKEAEAAGKEATRLQKRAAGYAKEEGQLQAKLIRAERTEADAAERRRKIEQQRADRRAHAERTRLESRIDDATFAVSAVLRQLPKPKPEKLRVLMLGASAEGDLRIGREQKRIRQAVEHALHREQIEFDVRPAATTADLLDGVTKFRPHVVHFSGHSNDRLIVFEDEVDERHDGVVVTAGAFAQAIAATDEPPLLVVLNSCHSAPHIDGLVVEAVPFAIGMADSIDDVDAINYAAQFYAAIANGQSIQSSHLSAQAALELAGLESADLPTLASAADVDPSKTILVTFDD